MTLSNEDWLKASLSRRETAETVARRIIEHLGSDAPRHLRGELRSSFRQSTMGKYFFSSMPTTFDSAVPMDQQVAKAMELAQLFLDQALPEATSLEDIDAFLDDFNALIFKARNRNSFRYHRLNRDQRAQAGLTLSRRRYDKMFRMAARMEDRFKRLKNSIAIHALVMISKSGLVAEIDTDRLSDKPWTLSFIAYYTARMKRRSAFTIDPQERPFDTISSQLLKGCEEREDADWFSIAHVFPREDVIARLSEDQKGQLLGRWHAILTELAVRLRTAHERTSINLETMIVRRGNDSWTWNVLAGAFNQARESWIALNVALGLEPLFDIQMPGKVMRLMAADVAYWHRATGGSVHPDTKVWMALPKPWDVLNGEAVCTREMIEAACTAHGVRLENSGWTAPRARRHAVIATPTPELVHGVAVANPYLASTLKRWGAYSGKPIKTSMIEKIVRGS